MRMLPIWLLCGVVPLLLAGCDDEDNAWRRPVYYAPPPVVAAPPAYYPPPGGYYAPPPGYYGGYGGEHGGEGDGD